MSIRDNHGPCLLCGHDCLDGQNLVGVRTSDGRTGLAHYACLERVAPPVPAQP